MKRLLLLTLLVSCLVVVYGAFPTWTYEFNDSKTTGMMAGYDSFRQAQAIAFQGRTCPSSTEAEKQAYDVSDQVAPKYIYQWCGACPVAQTE